MSSPHSGPFPVLELPTQTLKGLYSLFDVTERTLGNLRVARALCRSARSLLARRTTFSKRELSAAKFQDLLRRVAQREEDLARMTGSI